MHTREDHADQNSYDGCDLRDTRANNNRYKIANRVRAIARQEKAEVQVKEARARSEQRVDDAREEEWHEQQHGHLSQIFAEEISQR